MRLLYNKAQIKIGKSKNHLKIPGNLEFEYIFDYVNKEFLYKCSL